MTIVSKQAPIIKPNMRWLDLGRTDNTAAGLRASDPWSAFPELAYFEARNIELASIRANQGMAKVYEGDLARRLCSVDVRKAITKNQVK